MRAEIINASAGSGKTYRLAYNYVRDVVWKPMLYRHILAVTFTNKATEEMKSRILKEINLLASGQKSNYLKDLERDLGLGEAEIRRRALEARSAILHDYSRFTVLTIDKFFQRILHAFIKELGLELNYEIELEPASVLNRGVDALIERLAENKELRTWLESYARERMEEQKGWDLRESIRRIGKELFNEQSRKRIAATGSREELERGFKELWEEARQTQKQFREMGCEAVKALEGIGASLADFSYRNTSGAAYFYTVASGKTEPPKKRARDWSSRSDCWLPKAAKKSGLEPHIEGLRCRLEALCDWYDNHHRAWTTARLIKEHFRTFALLSDLYNEIQLIWRDENRLLLSETKSILSTFIDRNDTPFIYEKVGNRYDRYLFDEFQDTSQQEWLNFLPLVRDALSHPTQLSLPTEEEIGPTALLVGDTKQSIYRWRGGDWSILGRKAPEALEVATVESMNNNFRSLPQIVGFNNALIGRVVELAAARIGNELDEQGIDKEPLIDIITSAYTDHAQTARRPSARQGYVSIETSEKMPPVVERICRILDLGFRPADILILVRGATDGGRVARALLDFKQQNDNPRYHFDVMTQDALSLNASPLCSFIIALFRLALDPKESVQRAICNRYLRREVEAPLPSEEEQLLRSLKLLSPEAAFEEVVLYFGLNREQEQVAYLQALHEEIINFSSGRITDLSLFLEWWEEHGDKCALRVGDSDSTIEISTIHSSKGLERKVIIIPFCSWELNPGEAGLRDTIVWAEGDSRLQMGGSLPLKYGRSMIDSYFKEEYYHEMTRSYVDCINLLYVALTRAKEQLHIFLPNCQTSRISSLMWEALQIDLEAGTAHIPHPAHRGGTPLDKGRVTQSGELLRCEFGQFEGPDPSDLKPKEGKVELLTLKEYPTLRPAPELRLPTARFHEHDTAVELSPRIFGILMHRIFEQATDRNSLHEALRRLHEEALLNQEELSKLEQLIEEALREPTVASWFDHPWERILSERDIILPPTGEVGEQHRRPDRVMLDGRRAVVVDYKFGEKDPSSNITQIRRYMKLLRRMGYLEVEGWLWYVRLGRTEAVSEV